jgi:predicted MFS family arabinose efflux permease
MITLATYGAGMLVGFWLAGLIADQYKTVSGHDWNAIWMVPAGIAAAILVLFLLLFKDPSLTKK